LLLSILFLYLRVRKND